MIDLQNILTQEASPSLPKISVEEQKSWFKKLLSDNVAVVYFTKVDGTNRDIKCTLMPEHLPEQVINTEKKPRKLQSPENISVFDLNANSWKTIKVENVIGIEIIYAN